MGSDRSIRKSFQWMMSILGVAALSLSCSLSAVAPESAAAETISLKLNVNVGDTFRYQDMQKIMVEVEQGAASGGETAGSASAPVKIAVPLNIGMGWKLSVDGLAPNGNVSFLVQLESINFTSSLNGLNFEFNSEKEILTGDALLNSVQDLFKGIAGESLQMVVTPYGKVVSVSGLEKLYMNIMKAGGVADVEAVVDPNLKKMLAEAESRDLPKYLENFFFVPFPEDNSSIGGNWEEVVTAKDLELNKIDPSIVLPENLSITRRWVVVGKDKDSIQLDETVSHSESPIKIDINDPLTKSQIKLEMKLFQQTRYHLHPESMMIKSTKNSLAFEADINNKTSAGKQENGVVRVAGKGERSGT